MKPSVPGPTQFRQKPTRLFCVFPHTLFDWLDSWYKGLAKNALMGLFIPAPVNNLSKKLFVVEEGCKLNGRPIVIGRGLYNKCPGLWDIDKLVNGNT